MKKEVKEKKKGISWGWIPVLIILLLIIFESNSNYKSCVKDCLRNSDCTSTHDSSIDTYSVSASCYIEV